MSTIRGRLLWLLLGGLTVVLIGGGVAVERIARAGLVGQLDDGLEARALTVASLVKLEPGRLLFEASDAPAGPIGETYFELCTVDGEVLKRSRNLGDLSLESARSTGVEPVFADTDLPGDVHGRVVSFSFLPRVDEDDWEGVPQSQRQSPERLIVTAALDRGAVDRALAALRTGLLAVGGIVGATAAGLVVFGIRWGLRPLHRLTSQLEQISGDQGTSRIDGAGAPGELTPIYSELNAMLARVEATIRRERSFADAAAHELRTPLAELRTLAEVTIRWPDAERTAAALREVLSIGKEIERLVESLLLISRANGRAQFPASADTDLSTVVRDTLHRVNGEVERKALTMQVDVDSRRLQAPRDAVEIIVRNLIDNAVQYTPPHGSIVIAGRGDNGTAGFSVENGPVDLTDEQLPLVFEPFWRADAARTDRIHVGLGLTVVERVASAIGYRIDATLSHQRLCISLLPIDTPASPAK